MHSLPTSPATTTRPAGSVRSKATPPVAVGQNSITRLDEELAQSDVGAMSLLLPLLGALRAAVRTHRNLALENLALRQQLALLRRRSKRPRFGSLDRAFWVWLSRRWAGWREALHIVRPETVIRWHRKGFRSLWTWKSRRGQKGSTAHRIEACGTSSHHGARQSASGPCSATNRRSLSSSSPRVRLVISSLSVCSTTSVSMSVIGNADNCSQ